MQNVFLIIMGLLVTTSVFAKSADYPQFLCSVDRGSMADKRTRKFTSEGNVATYKDGTLKYVVVFHEDYAQIAIMETLSTGSAPLFYGSVAIASPGKLKNTLIYSRSASEEPYFLNCDLLNP